MTPSLRSLRKDIAAPTSEFGVPALRIGRSMDTTTVSGAQPAEVTSTVFADLRPADRAVALMALVEALKAEADAAKVEALRLADLTGAKSFRTPMGTVSVTQKATPVRVNEAKLVEWVKVNLAGEDMIETVEQVKPWAAKMITDRLVIIGGDVYDNADLHGGSSFTVVDGIVVLEDGTAVEPVPFATPGDAPDPYVSWPASADKRAAQAAARAWVSGKSTELAHRVLEAGS
ncbi:hypothetical protein [Microbacterium enclense]|uniref:hypothetical protein n=1 Tax=Microbacterium enclense TaxID=993073 RepID=UPI003F8031CF